MEPIRVAIIGGGMMGCGIAAAAAAAGNSVAVAETAEPVRRNGPERVAALLKELEDNGLAQPGAAEALPRPGGIPGAYGGCRTGCGAGY